MHARCLRILVVALVLVAGCSAFAGEPAPRDRPETTAIPDTPHSPESDLDGDGFTACQERELLDENDPTRMDVFVEVDWTAGAKPDQSDLDRLVTVYDDAPVMNPGKNGVRLHLNFDDELPTRDEPVAIDGVDRDTLSNFDNAGRGYHYALFVENLRGDVYGTGENGTILVATNTSRLSGNPTTELFAHELGHSLGLTLDVFDGIDDWQTPYSRYPSIMNRNAVGEDRPLDFSNGSAGSGDFDDWGYLDEHLFVPNTSVLDGADAC